MNQYIHVEGFSDTANKKMNEAIKLADKHYSDSVSTAHLGFALLSDDDIQEDFGELTGISAKEFMMNMLLPAIKNESLEFNEYEGQVEGITEELHKFIGNAVLMASKRGEETDKIEMYRQLIYSDYTYFHKALILAGVDPEELEEKRGKIDYLPALRDVSVNLNKMALNKELDPIESRDDIVDSVIEVLGRRQKGNPCLIGDAGVGKTAIVEGLAQRIVENKVPSYLKDKNIISVDIASIISGCKLRGEFEEKFNDVINEATKSKNIILFFDEIHTIIGAGANSEGSVSASSMLKPVLARGDIRIIGATTTKEYKRFIEKDTAFERRLQPIIVNEPSVGEAISMVEKVAPIYAKYHNANISKEVIESAVKLSDKYIYDRKLPDKAITVLDETAARLKAIGDSGRVTVTVKDIRETIAKTTGIDVREIGRSDKEKLAAIDKRIKRRIIGQDEAVEVVCQAIKRNKAGIRKHARPIGSFLFIGPTGVGKTELTKVLAKELFGSEDSIIRLDMSEYMEKHSVSKLIGSPPGYVGHEEGGQLADMVKRNPYSIILADEVEKAHPDVLNIFLQIMDDGRLTDSRGDTIDFKNTILIMTSNAGHSLYDYNKKEIGFNAMIEMRGVSQDDAIKELEKTFRPEFLNRLDKVVTFNKLSKFDIRKIVRIMLKDISDNLEENNVDIRFSNKLVNTISEEGFSDKYGARNIRRKIQDSVENYLTDLYLKDILVDGIKLELTVSGEEIIHKEIVKEVAEIYE